MRWVYLSPHLDDAVYSCGGMIWEQAHSGQEVEIWTICAGDPHGPLSPFALELHARWQTGPEAVAARRQEDEQACQWVGARARHFSIPDCIYRRLPGGHPVIEKNEDLFAPVRAEEAPLLEQIRLELAGSLGQAALVSPLTLGGHMDHRLVRAAAEALGQPLWYYADFPYVIMEKIDLQARIPAGWQPRCETVSPQGLLAWQEGVAAYRSQISSFWPDEAAMCASLEAYARGSQGAACLWSPR